MNAQTIAEALIASATRVLPPEERKRWRDEWLAELAAERATASAKLRFALGICAGVCVMASEFRSHHAMLRTAGVMRSHHVRPTAGARPPYNAGVEFWS